MPNRTNQRSQAASQVDGVRAGRTGRCCTPRETRVCHVRVASDIESNVVGCIETERPHRCQRTAVRPIHPYENVQIRIDAEKLGSGRCWTHAKGVRSPHNAGIGAEVGIPAT